MTIIVAKILIIVLCFISLTLLVVYKRQFIQWVSSQNTNFILAASWVVFRLLPYLIVFIIFQYEPSSDITGYLMPWGTSAKNGLLIYRDFNCTYSPFYPYILAIALSVWYNTKAIVFLMIIFEGIAFALTQRLAHDINIPKGENIFRAVFYLLLPATTILCVLGGQEDEWMWLFGVLAYFAWKKTQKIEIFILFIFLGMLCTKAIYVLFLLPTLILVQPKPRVLGFGALVGVIILATLYYFVGFNFLQPIQEANTLRSPNLPSVLNPIFFDTLGFGSKLWNWVGLLVSLSIGTWASTKIKNISFPLSFSAVWVIIYGTMMVVQQSAYANYVFIFMLPLVFFWIDFNNKKEVILLLIYNILSPLHPSIWWRIGQPKYNSMSDIFGDWLYFLDYLIQTSIVSLTIYFIYLVYHKVSYLNQKFDKTPLLWTSPKYQS